MQIFTILFILTATGFSKNFNVDSLPYGKDVTLPRPAISTAQTTGRFSVASTDLPQTLKLSSVHLLRKTGRTIKVRLMNSENKIIRRLSIRPGRNYMYSFQSLEQITILPDLPGGRYALRLESDKPLTIIRK